MRAREAWKLSFQYFVFSSFIVQTARTERTVGIHVGLSVRYKLIFKTAEWILITFDLYWPELLY